jgi:hypothetical protein
VLQLDGLEYAQCPDALRFTHLAEGVQDPVVPEVTATTELTVVPCTINYESQVRPLVTLQFLVWDDTELSQSTSTLLDCWFNEDLSDIGTLWGPTRSTTYQTQVRPGAGNRCRGGEREYQLCTDDDQCLGGLCQPSSGLLGVAETFRVREDSSLTGSSAINLHMIGTRESDTIFLQTGVLGVCDAGPNVGNPCTGDMECPDGACVAELP